MTENRKENNMLKVEKRTVTISFSTLYPLRGGDYGSLLDCLNDLVNSDDCAFLADGEIEYGWHNNEGSIEYTSVKQGRS